MFYPNAVNKTFFPRMSCNFQQKLNMANISFINGFYRTYDKSLISINDRSLHFSDAVYEVIPVYDSKLIFWKKHLKRLKNSLKQLDIKFKVNEKVLKIQCNEIIERKC